MPCYKILYHHRTAAQDGQAVHIEEMVRAFERAGHEVEIVAPAVRADSFGGESKLARLKARLPNVAQELLELTYGVRTFFKLRRAIKSFKPDFIYERNNLYLPSGIWAAHIYDLPLILEVNAPLADERASNKQLALPSLARKIETYIWRRADAVITVSHALKDMVHCRGVHSDHIYVMHNGIDTSLYPENKRAHHDEGHITLGFIGFVRDWHRLDWVIDALADAKLSKAQLIIAGDGPALPALKTQAAELGLLDRIDFRGLVKRADIPALLSEIDIALQPGVTAYASPLKLFEYMAASCAIIAVDQANIREILSHKENALLVDAENQSALKEAFVDLLTDHKLRQKLGTSARDSIFSAPYTWDHNAARTIELFENLKAAASKR